MEEGLSTQRRYTREEKTYWRWVCIIMSEFGKHKPHIVGIVLDLSQPGSSSLIEALIGDKDAGLPLREALESRWSSLPESSSRLLIRYDLAPSIEHY